MEIKIDMDYIKELGENIAYNHKFEFVESVENMENLKLFENYLISKIAQIFRANDIIISKSIFKNIFGDLIEMYIRNFDSFGSEKEFKENLNHNIELILSNHIFFTNYLFKDCYIEVIKFEFKKIEQ